MKLLPLRDWLAADRDAAEVPCGDCNACCRSGYFIHVEPDEAATLAAIPAALLFPAPGLPQGHKLMGYGADGACPMLRDGRCSIYGVRPRACRRYDCRVFAVTGVEPEPDKIAVRSAVAQWRVECEDATVQQRLDAIRRAAAYLRTHAAALPATGNPGQRALQAIALAHMFPGSDSEPNREVVAAELERRTSGG